MSLLIKKWLNLRNLVYLTIFLLPLYLIRIKFLFISTNGLEIIIGIIFLVWLSQDKNLSALRPFYSNYKKYIICAGLIFLGFILATFLNGNYLSGLGIIKSWFIIPIAFLLIIASIASREKINAIFLAYYLSALGVASIALFYLILGVTTFDGRLTAFFNSPNYLAMYLAPALIVGLMLKQAQNLGVKISYYLSLLIILISLYFTFSYAAWIALALAVLIVFLIQHKMSFKKISIIFILFILLILIGLRSDKFNSLITLDQRSSLVSRIMIWKASTKMIENNWFLGIGPGNFQDKYLEYQKYYPPYLEWAVPHPHNLYLAFWLYGGILSLAGFIGMVFFWLRDILKFKNATNFMALGIMLYILIHGLVDTTYFKNDLSVVFWLCFLALKKT